VSEILKAAGEVRKLSTMFKALAEIGPALEMIGSLEQAEREAGARISAIKAQEAELHAAVDCARQRLDDVESIAADVKAQAEASAKETRQQAHKDAAALVKLAEARATYQDAIKLYDLCGGQLAECKSLNREAHHLAYLSGALCVACGVLLWASWPWSAPATKEATR
jgi:hypothetical protein